MPISLTTFGRTLWYGSIGDAASGSGFTTYYPDRQGTSEGHRGPSHELLLREAPIANLFHRALAANLKGILVDNGLKGDEHTAVGSKQGALTGSIFAKEPVVLVEMVVLTNPRDESIVSSKKGRKRLADALAAATIAALDAP